MIVTAIDTTGIQSYIFGSNILKHNVGASELVRCATQDWVYQELTRLGATNVDLNGCIDGQAAIEHDDLVSELIYAGGGNTVLLFRSAETAHEFARCLTRRTLLNAPGLQLIIAHSREFDWKTEVLSQMVKATLEKANRKKLDHLTSAPLLGLSVTADCQYTGLPATGNNKDGMRISAEIRAKEETFKDAHDRLTHWLPLNGYKIPKEFDDFGRTKGESSYIAVVHTDGNGMGKRVADIANMYKRPEDNRPYINKMSEFSKSITIVAQEAMKATFLHLIDSIDHESKICGVVQIRDGKLPLRPIVMGGDDVTLVCEGRLALTLTAFYLKQIMAKPLVDGNPLSIRAGIAVVKSHFPFARAYAVSEELAKSAKDYLSERKAPLFNEQGLSAIDWHFAVSGVVMNLKSIREREYTCQDGKLTMRPLRIGSIGSDWRSWDMFTHIIEDFRTKKEWTERRNKVNELGEVLRNGKSAVEQFLQAYGLPPLPDIQSYPDASKTGWIGDRCTCFDAIEALEFFVPLEEVKK
jgi:hypothetical protein